MDAERTRAAEALILKNLTIADGVLPVNFWEVQDRMRSGFTRHELSIAATNLICLGKASLLLTASGEMRLKIGGSV